jgi:hypothetical protein
MSGFRNRDGALLVGVGDTIEWCTIGGVCYKGTIVLMDSNVAHVRVQDGTIKTVEL